MTGSPRPRTCCVCGSPAPGADDAVLLLAGWIAGHGPDRGLEWVCPGCAREHLRSVEARLDTQWW